MGKDLEQIRSLARHLINQNQLSECPVCHVNHSFEKLKELVESTMSISQTGFQDLLKKRDDLDKKVDLSTPIIRDLNDLLYIKNIVGTYEPSLPLSTVEDILKGVRYLLEEKERLRGDFSKEKMGLSSILNEGFDLKEKNELLSSANLELHLDNLNADKLSALIEASEKALEELDQQLSLQDPIVKENSQKVTDGQSLLKKLFPDLNSVSQVRSLMNEVAAMQKSLKEQTQFFPEDYDLRTLSIDSEKVRLHLESIVTRKNQNEITVKTIQTISESVEKQSQEKAKLEKKIIRCLELLTIFKDIFDNYSLDKASEKFLKENKELIEAIFFSIHSPKEFEAIKMNDGIKLVKDGQDMLLSEVSTGQRSALALSIFIGMHLSSPNAPKFMMFDDPISFVDDLNILSFLDLLRDLVVNHKRQIFFATANAKLAALFKKKFSFLESQFEDIEFER